MPDEATAFTDIYGESCMMSPPVEFFTDLIAPHFAAVESSVAVQSLRQLIAWGKTSK